MAESVYKIERKKPFTTVFRSAAQDKRLSLKARGLFLLMQSLPDDWDYTISGLAGMAGTGKDQIRSGLTELTKVGYLVKEQGHNEAGKFANNIFVLQDEAPPLSGNPTTENPSTGNPSTENPTEHNKISTVEDCTIPPIVPQGTESMILFDRFWRLYPKKRNKEAARRAWKRLNPSMALCRTMDTALREQMRSDDWSRDGGQYIPYPASWLNGRRWEDESPQRAAAEQRPAAGDAEGVTYF